MIAEATGSVEQVLEMATMAIYDLRRDLEASAYVHQMFLSPVSLL